jgi:hypothetical protein
MAIALPLATLAIAGLVYAFSHVVDGLPQREREPFPRFRWPEFDQMLLGCLAWVLAALAGLVAIVWALKWLWTHLPV